MLMSLIDRTPGQGRPIPGGIRLWSLDTNTLKDASWSRVESGRVFFHADTGEEFVRQLTAEAKERDKRGRWLWTQQGRQANHYLDTIIYALAMADPECWGGVKVLPKPEPERPRPVA
jgi:phage terminase large subunit GpA-like protein